MQGIDTSSFIGKGTVLLQKLPSAGERITPDIQI
jgi:hypothetical protein